MFRTKLGSEGRKRRREDAERRWLAAVHAVPTSCQLRSSASWWHNLWGGFAGDPCVGARPRPDGRSEEERGVTRGWRPGPGPLGVEQARPGAQRTPCSAQQPAVADRHLVNRLEKLFCSRRTEVRGGFPERSVTRGWCPHAVRGHRRDPHPCAPAPSTCKKPVFK